MSRRARERAAARPWQHPAPADTPIDWSALQADIARRAQQAPQHQQEPKQ